MKIKEDKMLDGFRILETTRDGKIVRDFFKDSDWKVIIPQYLYRLGVKMWGKKYMQNHYLEDRKVKLK